MEPSAYKKPDIARARRSPMPDNPLSPTQNIDLRQIVYEKIKEAILDGIIHPGERLSEVDLAEKLTVSRTPVREAIRQLAETKLVALIPRKGAYVVLLSVQDAKDLYELRSALECCALTHLCQNPPAEALQEVRAVFDGFNDSMSQFIHYDRQFHSIIRSGSGNKFLNSVLDNVVDLIQLCRRYALEVVPLATSAAEHVGIIDAILARDVEKSQRLLRDHLRRASESLATYLEKHPEFSRQTP